MGNRASVSFSKDGCESVTLFSHWGGREFQNRAKNLALELKKAANAPEIMNSPLGRLEPGTVMVEFIRQETKELDLVTGNYYLGKDSGSGDNSDNGHLIIRL